MISLCQNDIKPSTTRLQILSFSPSDAKPSSKTLQVNSEIRFIEAKRNLVQLVFTRFSYVQVVRNYSLQVISCQAEHILSSQSGFPYILNSSGAKKPKYDKLIDNLQTCKINCFPYSQLRKEQNQKNNVA